MRHCKPILPFVKILLFMGGFSFFYVIVFLGIQLFHSQNLQETQTTTMPQLQEESIYDTSPAFQQEVAKKILRLHVIANSDSTADQVLKMQVRNAILDELQHSLAQANTVKEAETLVSSQLSNIQRLAQDAIARQDYTYPVSVTLQNRYFPAKQYGDLTFPPGNYRALCVEIGQAQGRNWWCVLFPSLCFVNDTTAVVPEASKKSLAKNLGEDAYHRLAPASATPSATPSVVLHSALYDWMRQKK